MKLKTQLMVATAALACAGVAFAQTAPVAEPRNVVQLSANGTVEVQQDLLVLNLATSKEAADAATVQTQLKLALDAALTEAKRIADLVTTALGGCGLFGVELFVKDDFVWFSEVSPRPHDTGLVTLASQFQSEFELHARAILGLPVDTTRHSVAASAVIYAGMDGRNLSFTGMEQALTVAGSDLRLFGKPEGFARRRMGVATVRAVDTDTARKLAKQAADAITVS